MFRCAKLFALPKKRVKKKSAMVVVKPWFPIGNESSKEPISSPTDFLGATDSTSPTFLESDVSTRASTCAIHSPVLTRDPVVTLHRKPLTNSFDSFRFSGVMRKGLNLPAKKANETFSISEPQSSKKIKAVQMKKKHDREKAVKTAKSPKRLMFRSTVFRGNHVKLLRKKKSVKKISVLRNRGEQKAKGGKRGTSNRPSKQLTKNPKKFKPRSKAGKSLKRKSGKK